MSALKTKHNHYLSKSLFIKGLQCHKALYLEKCHPELKDEISDEQQARFEAGYDIGSLALGLFPGGVMIPYDGLSHDEQVAMTKEAIRKGTQTIYEASFKYDDIFVKVDIFHNGLRGWEVYEIKSSSHVKDVHLYDSSVQYYALIGSGLPISSVSVVTINTDYVRYGDLNIKKLFSISNITARVQDQQDFVLDNINAMRQMLRETTPPVVDIGPHCSDPYECAFIGHCRKHIPEDSVFDLKERGVDRWALYRQGILRQHDIPLEMLNVKQRQQVESSIERKDSIDRKQVRAFLKTIWYPLCFLDFETVQSPVPLFDGTWPYQQIPFQYSLHVQRQAGGAVGHFEFLAEPGKNPRKDLLAKLLAEIPKGACVLAYNVAFEKGILESLGEVYQKHRRDISAVIKNMRDLMAPFKSRAIYLWQQKGSYSLKAVLPAMVPELSYDELEIGDGGAASSAYFEMCEQDKPQEHEKIRKALLEYCKLDTLAMVRILEKMETLVSH